MSNPTIALPFPTAKLSGHAKGGWRKNAGPVSAARALAWGTAMEHKPKMVIPPHPDDIYMVMDFYPPNRRSDRVNFANRMKAYIDGIAEALGFNDVRVLPAYNFHQPDKHNPRVEVRLGEVPDA